MENMLGASRLPLTVLIDGNGKVLEKIYGARQWTAQIPYASSMKLFVLDLRRGRMAQRQSEIKARAATRPIEAKDFSAVRFDDGTADREP